MAGLAGVGGKAERSAAILGNSSCSRPLAVTVRDGEDAVKCAEEKVAARKKLRRVQN